MSVPFVKFNVSQQGGPARPGTDGIAAIIAPSASGPLNTPSGFNDYNVAIPTFGAGPLCRIAAQVQPVADAPFVLVRASASVAATYSAITESGAAPGTSAITAGASAPNDDYTIQVTFTAGGTVAAAGILYTYSLNPLDPSATSAVQALGTANTITIPGTNATLDLGAGTIAAGQIETFKTTGARMNSSDLGAALTALQRTSQPWETVYVFGESTATTFSAVSSMLTAKAILGSNQHSAVLTCRPRAQDGTETEAQYATSVEAIFSASADQRIVVAADACQTYDPILKTNVVIEAGIPILARGMAIDISRDPAVQGDGPLPNITIDDANGNPVYHDELKDPGLDDNRFATLRSWDGYTGAFVNNARVMSAVGSPYYLWQQWRVMGRGMDIAYQTLVPRLSAGVRRNQTTGFILEVDAAEIDGLVKGAVSKELLTSTPQRCSGVGFKLSRTDNLSVQSPVCTGQLQLSFLVYIKGFQITVTVVETVTVNG